MIHLDQQFDDSRKQQQQSTSRKANDFQYNRTIKRSKNRNYSDDTYSSRKSSIARKKSNRSCLDDMNLLRPYDLSEQNNNKLSVDRHYSVKSNNITEVDLDINNNYNEPKVDYIKNGNLKDAALNYQTVDKIVPNEAISSSNGNKIKLQSIFERFLQFINRIINYLFKREKKRSKNPSNCTKITKSNLSSNDASTELPPTNSTQTSKQSNMNSEIKMTNDENNSQLNRNSYIYTNSTPVDRRRVVDSEGHALNIAQISQDTKDSDIAQNTRIDEEPEENSKDDKRLIITSPTLGGAKQPKNPTNRLNSNSSTNTASNNNLGDSNPDDKSTSSINESDEYRYKCYKKFYNMLRTSKFSKKIKFEKFFKGLRDLGLDVDQLDILKKLFKITGKFNQNVTFKTFYLFLEYEYYDENWEEIRYYLKSSYDILLAKGGNNGAQLLQGSYLKNMILDNLQQNGILNEQQINALLKRLNLDTDHLVDLDEFSRIVLGVDYFCPKFTKRLYGDYIIDYFDSQQ